MTDATKYQITYLTRDRAEQLNATWTSDSSYGFTSLPASVLSRHGARMLDPMTAYQVDRFRPVAPTVYRTNELLIRNDNDKLHNTAVATMADVLRKQLGLVMDEARAATPLIYRGLLRPDPNPVAARPAAVADAWRSLQVWRSAALQSGSDEIMAALNQISLNYVMVGAAMGGIGGVSEILRGVPGAIGGNPNPGTDVDELGYWRRPVAIRMSRPTRTEPKSGRRPVIAVLDTGLAENEWLSVTRSADGKYVPSTDCAFLTGDGLLDDPLPTPRSAGVTPSYWEGPFTVEPLTGYLSSHTGHATFVIGVIHQAEPDVDILSVRVMYNDGIVYAHVLVQALRKLLDRVKEAQNGGDPKLMVDVVSLSLGGYREAGQAGAEYDQLTKAIDDLRERGVIIVAAAGNYASSRPFFPAALADRPDDDFPPVISVGACNPNGTKAFFSNDGPWVRCWAAGAGIISTFPENINGSRGPLFRVTTNGGNEPLAIRESLESDDYRYGYAEWNGTSFAAPLAAAKIAKLLMEQDCAVLANDAARGVAWEPEAFTKSLLRTEATLRRAKAAVAKL